MRIGYTFVIADLFHYGILQLLLAARRECDALYCGLLTDEAARAAKGPPLSNYRERRAVLEALRCVDKVVVQRSQDPTDNIEAIRREHPDAEIVFVYGDQWRETPGGENLRPFNVKTMRQAFYDRLGEERIVSKTVRSILPDNSVLETFTAGFAIKDFESFKKRESRVPVTTKARTLQILKPLLRLFSIEKSYVFTVEEWRSSSRAILGEIAGRFAGGRIVARSSCVNEDTLAESRAGRFDSVLGVPAEDPESVCAAVERIIASYGQDAPFQDLDQVLIQRQTEDVVVSGVLFTQDLENNAPYYVINYDDSGRTDTVTSGQGGKLLKIFRSVEPDEVPSPWGDLLRAVRELEERIPDYPLDIEFAVTRQGRLVLFQARPLAANCKAGIANTRHVAELLRKAAREYETFREDAGYVDGGNLIYSDMIFWNPAELIGHNPSNLAYGLFRKVVMDKAWNLGISCLGYPNVYPEQLMRRILYKPYINANLAFLATVPEAVPRDLRPGLHDFFLAKLRDNPHLHDKAEFEIMFSCWDFAIHRRLAALGDHGFDGDSIALLEKTLLGFTQGILRHFPLYHEKLSKSVAELERYNALPLEDLVERVRRERNLLPLKDMLQICESNGAIPFAAAARCAFIAEALIRSLEVRGVVSSQEVDLIRNAIPTVATSLAKDMSLAARGALPVKDFLGKYGHLRAGTYDIKMPRYDRMPDMNWLMTAHDPAVPPEIPEALRRRLDDAIRRSDLGLDFDRLFAFAKTFIAAREYFKFVYTRTLSNALEVIRAAAADRDLTAGQVSLFDLDTVYSLYGLTRNALSERVERFESQAARWRCVQLPPLLCSSRDLLVFAFPESSPNFITSKSVQGPLFELGDKSPNEAALDGKIVFVENADPGYHWIFSRNIRGLVTKYGGAASHLAICCAEFGIPAAIGCDIKYDQLKQGREILLDCANHVIAGRA